MFSRTYLLFLTPKTSRFKMAREKRNSNPKAPVVDPEESKRAANRLAQRKFRRQRKDYVAQLERELAVCREGATGELVHRRQEVAKLTREKVELRELLEQVATTLGRVCGVAVTMVSLPSQDGESTRQESSNNCSPADHPSPPPLDQDQDHSQPPIEPATPDQTLAQILPVDRAPTPTSIDPFAEGGDPAATQASHPPAEGHGCRLDDHLPHHQIPLQTILPTDPVAELDTQVAHVDSPMADIGMQPTDAEPILPWDNEPDQAVLPASASSQAEQGPSCFNQPADHTSALLAPTEVCSPSTLMAFQSEVESSGSQVHAVLPASILVPRRFATPTIPKTLFYPSRQTGRHNGSEKTQMLTIMLRRQVEDIMKPYATQAEADQQTLETIESHLTSGIAEVISSIQSLFLRLMNISSISLVGGSAWVVWQIIKTFWVLPRLADVGVLSRASESDYESDVFRDTMPDWLRPTDMQKTFQHSLAIDFIPWARLRENLIIHQDSVSVDDVMVDILKREMPTGVDLDRQVDSTALSALDIRAQFHCAQDRLLRDCFYGSLSMFKIHKAHDFPSQDFTSVLVDQMMEDSSYVVAA